MSARRIVTISPSELKEYLYAGGIVEASSCTPSAKDRFHFFGKVFSSASEPLDFYSCLSHQDIGFITSTLAHTTTREGN